MRKKLIVLTTILGLIAFSGVAAAAEETESEDTGDTTFNFGYDEDNGVFIWGSSASDAEADCDLENGELKAIYVEEEGGLLLEDVLHLEEGGGDGDSVDSECALTAGEVAGPQGQINHGMFLKLFNAMFDGEARGCMVRHIAQSDLGKGPQQVNVPEVEDTEDTEDNGETEELTGTLEFETVMTDCVNGEDENGENGVDGQAKASEMRPDFVNDMLEDKAADGGDDDDGEVESEDEDSGRRGPPDGVPGKGPRG